MKHPPHAQLIPERTETAMDAPAGVSSEVALFPAQVPDSRRTRSLIVTKVVPICHRVLRSRPLMIKSLLVADGAEVTRRILCRLWPLSYTKTSRGQPRERKLWLR